MTKHSLCKKCREGLMMDVPLCEKCRNDLSNPDLEKWIAERDKIEKRKNYPKTLGKSHTGSLANYLNGTEE